MRLISHTIVLVTAATSLACTAQRALDLSRVKAFITSELAAQTGVTPTRVDCPAEVYEAPGRTFECRVFADDGSSAPVEVEMLGDGKVTFEVKP